MRAALLLMKTVSHTHTHTHSLQEIVQEVFTKLVRVRYEAWWG